MSSRINIEEVMAAADRLEKLLSDMKEITNGNSSSGNLWYTLKVINWARAALKISGFKVGQRITLRTDIPCTGGWKGSEGFLSKDKAGNVIDVDFADDIGSCIVLFQPFGTPYCYWIAADNFYNYKLPSLKKDTDEQDSEESYSRPM